MCAPGDGYVSDLQYAIDRVGTPLLTVTADLPLLGEDIVDGVLSAFDGRSLTVYVPAVLKRRLGVSVDRTVGSDPALAPTGVNVVADSGEDSYLVHDRRVAVNVNYRADAAVAEAIL